MEPAFIKNLFVLQVNFETGMQPGIAHISTGSSSGSAGADAQIESHGPKRLWREPVQSGAEKWLKGPEKSIPRREL